MPEGRFPFEADGLLAAVLDEVRGNQERVELDLGSAMVSDIGLVEADSIPASTTRYSTGGSESGALEALTSGGQISSVRQEGVRRLIARLPLVYVKAEDMTRQDPEFYAGVLRPYLRETVVLPQVSDAVGPRPGAAERYEITVTPYRYGVQLSDGRRDLSESIVIAVLAGGRRCALGTAVRPPTPPRAWGAETSECVRGIQPR